MNLRAIVTAGGTIEPVDSVRSITNLSTGLLGAEIVNELVSQGVETIWIHGKDAARPAMPCVEIPVTTVESASSAIKERLETFHPDLFIHAMAVSDFIVRRTISLEELFSFARESLNPEDLAVKIRSNETNPAKLSSNSSWAVIMEPCTKILDKIRAWCSNPGLYLVSFKLLADTTKDELFSVAENQLSRTGSNLVVANLAERVSENDHQAWFVESGSGTTGPFTGKRSIASALVDFCLSRTGH